MKTRLYPLVIILTLGITSIAHADDTGLYWLPGQKEVFPLLLADPRSAQFALQLYKVGDKTKSADSIGRQIPLVRYTTAQGDIFQIGLEAAAFIKVSVSAEAGNAALQDTDWFFGFPIEYRKGPWAFRVYGYHTSSHLGDNYLIANNVTPITYSREAFEALISYSWKQLTVYGGGSRAIHAIPMVDTTAAHAGFQAWSKPLDAKGITKLYAAADFQPKAEAQWQVQTNTETGVSITPTKSQTTMRVYLNYQAGPEPDGQFYQVNHSYLALGVAFDF